MNEPKRRGRPPKAKTEWETTVLEAKGPVLEEAKFPNPEQPSEFARRQAQAYANRVWKGQSVSEPRAWRLARVEEALKGQGLSMEGVEL
jgi:hypothetical protein